MPKRFVLACLLLTCLIGTAHADTTALPDLPGPASALLSAQQEHAMGRAWLRSLRSKAPILTDPLIQEYAEHLVWQLLAFSGLKNIDLDLVVVDTAAINAFAVPGGVIGLNAGTILNADNEDEVAAVLAHELAHVSQHHFSRRYADSRYFNRTFLLGLLASIALAATGHANAGMAGIATTQAAAIQSQLAYSRHQEAEADRIGMQTLAKAGFNPQAMPAFFEKLLKEERINGAPPKFLTGHPVTESRIADTEARADQLPATPYHNGLQFLLAQARLKARFIHEPSQAERYFKQLYKSGSSVRQLAAGYGLAIAMIRNQHYSKASDLLDKLIKQAPNNWWFKLAQAENQLAQRHYKRANRQLEQLGQLLPGNYAINVLHARSLLHSNQPQAAQQLLQQQLRQRPADPLLWKLLARAFGDNDQKGHAHLARGEYLFLTGHGKKGLEQLHYALTASKQNFPLHSRITARIKTMTAAEKEKF